MSLSRPESPITDGVVALVPLAEEHLVGLEAVGNDPLVQRFTRVPEPFGSDEARRWLALYEQGWEEGSRAAFAIIDPPTGAFFGMIGFVVLRLDRLEAEAGYIVAPEVRGRGIANRALTLLTTWGFATLGLERIELRVELENPASSKVAERCGYRYEGTLRGVHLKGTRRGDMAIYARLAADPAVRSAG